MSLSSCAKVTNSSNQEGIKCWGYNKYKNLGLPTSDETEIPAKDRPFVHFTLTVESIVPEVCGSCGVFSSQGSPSYVHCWGALYSAGNIYTTHDASNMVQINTPGDAVMIDFLRVITNARNLSCVGTFIDGKSETTPNPQHNSRYNPLPQYFPQKKHNFNSHNTAITR
ncbi:hypothetical protein GUITHDRAFT_149202 [Guillardia theta CCMP2712]|uniref:Uncharacterized protein n=1 Tax=Guillardia theta (strain CCMP2712) TaxID=905079 RepID=L1I5S6_GUITC|nr:hypothetical protein GUITHDRAFT_149202 [Guillardia theta CCMP2712]EKX31596.1 hypothetical protein GUITHDRAFT_149202 [Guillardia theta CCMP2712]|eukprot:XP_005818576.1 hypothetical protein GUITHDRAFT_149202 [Guillardia theta CCMP2712]